MTYKYDFLIIGAGIAGMSYALKVAKAKKGKVCIICKTTLDEANTRFAQGGVASVTNLELDNFDKHIHDTIVAGDYVNDVEAVKQVVTKAPEQIKALVEWGTNFDKKSNGDYDLHREGRCGDHHPAPSRCAGHPSLSLYILLRSLCAQPGE